MTDYICLKCNIVSNHPSGKCCGQEVELFDPAKHGKLLVGPSNCWISVSKRWEDVPLLKEAQEELIRDGCYSAPIIFNEFIQKLKDRIEKLES